MFLCLGSKKKGPAGGKEEPPTRPQGAGDGIPLVCGLHPQPDHLYFQQRPGRIYQQATITHLKPLMLDEGVSIEVHVGIHEVDAV